LAGLGGSQNSTQGGGASSVRDRRRTSDGANATMPGPALPGGDLSGGQNSGVPPLPGQSALPGTQTYPTGQPGFSGQPGMAVPGQAGFPGTVSGVTAIQPGANPSSGNSFGGGSSSFVGGGNSFVGGGSATPTYPGQTLPGQPGPPVNSQMGGVSPYPIQPGSNGMPPGFPQPGTVAGQGNAAADMIRNILTTPRPGGMPQGNPGGQVIGGGIAGVATNAEGEGVKVYNDRTLYQEWEFIFDPAKQKQIPNPNATGLGGTPAGQLGQPGQPGQTGQQPGLPGMSPMNPQMPRPPGQ
jgi:hypothetical protein